MLTSNPRTITADATVTEAAPPMREADTGVVPIVEDDRLVGTSTDRDFAIRVGAEEKDPMTTRAGDVSSRDLITVDLQQDLDEELQLMAQHQVRRLPVVEEDSRLVGIIAQADVAQHAIASALGKTVRDNLEVRAVLSDKEAACRCRNDRRGQ